MDGKSENYRSIAFFSLSELLGRGTAQSSSDPSPFSPPRKRLRLPLIRAAWTVKQYSVRQSVETGNEKGSIVPCITQEEIL